ncbi:MAG: 23S rRNA (uracil(1939)-C(5))-methyltransferase RlmD [Bacteroidota bacterium]
MVSISKKGYAEAIPISLHSQDLSCVQPFCSHFGTCGGCQWQHVSYTAQLVAKEELIREKLTRIGHIHSPPVAKILAAQPTQYYRNKLEFTFSNKRWLSAAEIQSGMQLDRRALGFHRPRYFDRVVDIVHCHLQPEPSNAIRLAVGQFAREQRFTFYDFRQNKGLLRNLIIRTASNGEVMVIVQFGQADEAKITHMMSHIQTQFPTVTSLQYVVNTKYNETFYDLPVHGYYGQPFITEQIDGLKWQIGPKSFFQTNTSQAQVLYSTVQTLADLQGGEVVYDLYTGVGTIAHFLARKARYVVGIDIIEGAIEDARTNAQLNQLANTSFWVGDMRQMLHEQLVAMYDRPSLVVADPPRAGIHPGVLEQLLRIAPEKIIYVSCNPATQARDIDYLQELYRLTKAQPIDMFPHTSHVENVALLVKKRKNYKTC